MELPTRDGIVFLAASAGFLVIAVLLAADLGIINIEDFQQATQTIGLIAALVAGGVLAFIGVGKLRPPPK